MGTKTLVLIVTALAIHFVSCSECSNCCREKCCETCEDCENCDTICSEPDMFSQEDTPTTEETSSCPRIYCPNFPSEDDCSYITRCEFAVWLVLYSGLEPYEPLMPGTFPDITPSLYCWEEVGIVKENGIMVGYSDGTFRPHFPITRAEAVKAIVITFDLPQRECDEPLFEDVPYTQWYETYVRIAALWGLLCGVDESGQGECLLESTFQAGDNTTRNWLVRALKNAQNPVDMTEELCGSPP